MLKPVGTCSIVQFIFELLLLIDLLRLSWEKKKLRGFSKTFTFKMQNGLHNCHSYVQIVVQHEQNVCQKGSETWKYSHYLLKKNYLTSEV